MFSPLVFVVVSVSLVLAQEETCRSCESCDQVLPDFPAGIPGDRGPVGERGDPGDSGPIGETGEIGETGDPGEMGAQGLRGPKGLKGEQGAQGDHGDQGESAEATEIHKGEKGVSGDQGPKGTNGFAGCPGKQGDQGDQGEKGEPGELGPEGPAGRGGEKGDQGPRGLAGPSGLRGRQGKKGSPGPPGNKGMIGAVGPTGDAGKRGTPGIPGAVDILFDLFEGPPGIPGAPGDINCSEEANIAEKFRGARGNKGDVGERGAYGLQGTRGPLGPPCECSQQDTTDVKGPRGVAGPSGEQLSQDEVKGESGFAPPCNCNKTCIKLPDLPTADPDDDVTPEFSVKGLVGVAGPLGPKGPKGDVGPPGNPLAGEKGERGPRGEPACCKKPPKEKSYGHTPTLYVVHSQSTDENVECLDEDAELLWTGFSFLYADINRVATGQDLGRPGSCVPRLDPLPYTDCTPGMPCNGKEKSMQAIWLVALQNETSTSSIPFDQLSQVVSRCAVCLAKLPVVTLHRTTECPANTRKLWSGYSLAMFSSSILSISSDLSHSGSCVRKFQPGLVIECDTSKKCRRYSDLRSHWLHGDNKEVPGENENCIVCVDERRNAYDRNLARPRIYAEHYQTPAEPINPCSSAPGVFPLMTSGYSLLHVEDTRAVVQDLGSAGSCMAHFSPVPFLTCPTFGSCYVKERQTKAAWLSGVHVPANKNKVTTRGIASRCSICISDSALVTIHSHNSSLPRCPQRGGKWASLWTGYSFLGHFSKAAGGQQPLDSPGSCLREFMSPVYMQCAGATGDCTAHPDQHDFWLTANNSGTPRYRNYRSRASNISRCVVCKLIINN